MSGVPEQGLPPGNARKLLVAAMIGLPVALIGWLLFYGLFRTTPGQDWMVFDTAVRAWMRGDTALLLDGPRFTAVLNQTHAAWMAVPLVFHPWVYPPYTLLLALPLAGLSWPYSYVGFQAASFCLLLAGLWRWRPAKLPWAFVAGVVLCPATAFTLGAGQNSFFSAGLVLLGLHWRTSRPRLAGLCLGLLAFKPQLALLVPLALAAEGAWVCFFVAGVTVAGLLVVSLAVPGLALWQGWLHLFLSGDLAFAQWVEQGRIYGQSVFSNLRVLGLPNRAANLGQEASIALAAFCVWRGFRVKLAPGPQAGILLLAMTLAAPHLGNYDAILTGIAAMLVLAEGARRRLGAGEVALAVLVWASTAANPPILFHLPMVTPILCFGLIFGILRVPGRGLKQGMA